MSQELIYETLYDALAVSHSILHIWLTVTFAVLVAAYVAGAKISRYLNLLITFLYGVASLVLTASFVSASYQIYYYRDLLLTEGYHPWAAPKSLAFVIGGGMLMLLVAGSAATLWFIYRVRQPGP